ncbi:hypothetical protein C6P40_002827 [Pichia californica]|uniref:Quinate/shikimate 5-dehydrogenase/glutamyl-tRNA reductase domain-containing protein n=1 Tax=Pichia californica TaxID=460514 RepID=A0A9P7BFE5_9ASCO|nr:hypothetical protein C6P42_004487 [[Candida] californica]KAG0690452.1 hypothetical protein C6P40_002827 [[Candida] californica]
MWVLTDTNVVSMFKRLTSKQILSYQKTLLDGLKEYKNNPLLIPTRIVSPTSYCTHIFMASTGTHVGMKAISTSSKFGMKGITTILEKENGYPIGIINSTTLTAFRTALCNTLPLMKFYPIEENYNNDKIITFGVGDQAKWHIWLALKLYPKRFSKVLIVNRTILKAENLCKEFRKDFPNIEFNSLSLKDTNSLKNEIKDTSVIFSCVPTTEPTVTKKLIDNCNNRCFISAIGSYKPHMIEIEGKLLKENIIKNNGKIIVDSIDHCLHEAGELIINNINKEHLIDVATLYTSSNSKFLENSKFAVSKLVGLCIMDVWVGTKCLEEAKKQGLGIEIKDF